MNRYLAAILALGALLSPPVRCNSTGHGGYYDPESEKQTRRNVIPSEAHQVYERPSYRETADTKQVYAPEHNAEQQDTRYQAHEQQRYQQHQMQEYQSSRHHSPEAYQEATVPAHRLQTPKDEQGREEYSQMMHHQMKQPVPNSYQHQGEMAEGHQQVVPNHTMEQQRQLAMQQQRQLAMQQQRQLAMQQQRQLAMQHRMQMMHRQQMQQRMAEHGSTPNAGQHPSQHPQQVMHRPDQPDQRYMAHQAPQAVINEAGKEIPPEVNAPQYEESPPLHSPPPHSQHGVPPHIHHEVSPHGHHGVPPHIHHEVSSHGHHGVPPHIHHEVSPHEHHGVPPHIHHEVSPQEHQGGPPHGHHVAPHSRYAPVHSEEAAPYRETSPKE